MASLSLPPPRKTAFEPGRPSFRDNENEKKETPAVTTTEKTKTTAAAAAAAAAAAPPSYETRCAAAVQAAGLSASERKERRITLFVPRSLQDFGDGGAYPEIHVAQYPRHMGNPHKHKVPVTATGKKNKPTPAGVVPTSRALVNVQVDKDGKVSYDSIVKGGTNSDKLVYTKHADLKPKAADEDEIAPATQEEVDAETARTQAALQAILSQKTALDRPSGSAVANAQTSLNQAANTQFIQYTPRPDAPGYNPAAAQRVIQMVPKQVDPMQPPKHKHVKAPPGPAEDVVPVLQAPPRKLTKEERDAWNIPACISNYKNMRGYTIPLDKRLAADGRGLQEHAINSNFATLSESLYVAERQARQEVSLRAQVQRKQALQVAQEREEKLRDLAQKARMDRGGGGALADRVEHDDNETVHDDERVDGPPDETESKRPHDTTKRPLSESDDDDDDHDDKEDQVAARQRERLRQERRKDRERDMRMEQQLKKQKLEQDRDISEKMALGVHPMGSGGGSGALTEEVDARLYNQSAGLDAGFGAEDEYNAYSAPLRSEAASKGASSIYRPTRGETQYNADQQYDALVKGATSKFKPDKGFAGAQGGMDVQAGPRTAPVQFEKGGPKK